MSVKIIKTPCGDIVHGLEEVLVKETKITDIDGERGIFWVRGYRIDELAKYSNYEEVAFLTLYGRLPKKDEFEEFKKTLASERPIPKEVADIIRVLAKVDHPMGVLITATSALRGFDPDAKKFDEEARMGRINRELGFKMAIRLIAKLPTIVAYTYRASRDLPFVEPRADLGHAANFLYMMFGREPKDIEVKAIDLYLVLHVDHEVPCSTFTGMVAASSLTDMYSAVAAAIAGLKGPLHGGANEAALKSYLEIGSPEKAREYVDKLLASGGKVMGVGHRVYKAYDPRARIYKELVRQVGEYKGDLTLYKIAEAVEQYVLSREDFQKKRLYPNIDFWTGVALYQIGIPPEYYTPLFAMSRVAGWTAHILEYWENNRIFRPRACYTGPHDVPYVPIDKR